jgi:hypothetical protein
MRWNGDIVAVSPTKVPKPPTSFPAPFYRVFVLGKEQEKNQTERQGGEKKKPLKKKKHGE